uniref:Uncharacterized protein n=1 Tax=Acrobeloides nanus TaxID=290746 RepID=A0A914C363_9BILA
MFESDDDNCSIGSATKRLNTERPTRTDVRRRLPNKLPISPPLSPEQDLYRKALTANLKNRVRLGQSKTQYPFPNMQSLSARRTIPFDSSLESTKSITDVILVQPIATISRHHTIIDQQGETKITYRVFFCSATIRNFDTIEENIKLLQKTDSWSEAILYEGDHNRKLVEVTQHQVLIGNGFICVERISEIKTSMELGFYKLSDKREKRDLCRAVIVQNPSESLRQIKTYPLSVRSWYESFKRSEKKFELKETIELIFGTYDSPYEPELGKIVEGSDHKTNRMDSPVTFLERIFFLKDKKLTIERIFEVENLKFSGLRFERTWFGQTRIHLFSDELDDNLERIETSSSSLAVSIKSSDEKRARTKLRDHSRKSSLSHIYGINPKTKDSSHKEVERLSYVPTTSNLTPRYLSFDESNQPSLLDNYDTMAQFSHAKVETIATAKSDGVLNTAVYDDRIDHRASTTFSDVSRRKTFEEYIQDTLIDHDADAELYIKTIATRKDGNDLVTVGTQSSNDSNPSHLGILSVSKSIDLMNKSLPQDLSLNAEKSFDLTRNPSKPVYHHKKSLRFCTTLDKTNATINLSLIVKSNRSTLDMELTELTMDGGTVIWKKPKEVNSNKEN